MKIVTTDYPCGINTDGQNFYVETEMVRDLDGGFNAWKMRKERFIDANETVDGIILYDITPITIDHYNYNTGLQIRYAYSVVDVKDKVVTETITETTTVTEITYESKPSIVSLR